MSRKILVVDDDPPTRVTFEFHLQGSGYEVASACSAEEALGILHAFDPDVIITDVQMEEMSGLELLHRVTTAAPDIDVIVVTGYEDMSTTIGAIREGAYDYLVKPLDLDQLDLVLQRCFRDRAARKRGRGERVDGNAGNPDFIAGRSPQMIEIYKQIGMLAGTRAPVLIRGETGTGKELIARAIHNFSPWAAEPFIAINCTAVAETLLESELFGHTKGSFTGAAYDRKGRFEQAANGTLFLDEIGDTSPAFQTKLLRVLQQREFYPVGSERPRRTEARVLAATHRPVEELIREGKFREDLYFRLRVVEIVIPPLRDRVEDIPLIAEHLLAKVSRTLHKDVRVIPPEVMRMLKAYPWPGNVREMENAIARAVVLAHGPVLSAEHLPLAADAPADAGERKPGRNRPKSLDETERAHVEYVLERTGGNKRRAAGILGISRPRLDRLLGKYSLDVPDTADV
jgi:DNA-binding NtrC family response regulator